MRTGKEALIQLRLGTVAGSLTLIVWLAAPAHALDQDDLDTLSRHGAASFEAFSKFGEVGEKLTDISSGKFLGLGLTGSQRRAMSSRVNAAMEPWRNASAAAKSSLSYRLVPSAMLATDIATSFIAPSMEGGIRGAVSGAVNIAVAPTVVGAFTALGTGAGTLVGSFVPVVGNAVGGMVGGAIGTAVGGYISAYAYDKYVKELVNRAVEGGFVAVFDTAPLQQAMQARQAFLHQNASPEVKAEWDRMNAASRSFSGGEGQVLDWERLPYIVEQRPTGPASSAATPLPQDQAALTAGNVLAGVRKFSIGKMEWDINGGVATYRQVYPGPATSVVTARGNVSPNRIEGTMVWTFPGDPNCDVRESEHFVYVFDAENVTGRNQPGPVELRGPCKGTWDKMTRGSSFTAPWRKID